MALAEWSLIVGYPDWLCVVLEIAIIEISMMDIYSPVNIEHSSYKKSILFQMLITFLLIH